MGETGLDYFRDRAPRDRQRRLFEAQLELAAELGKPVVIHTRDADADTADVLAGFDGTVVMHCFSSPGLLETVARTRLLRLVRRQRHVPEGVRSASRRGAGPDRADPRRDGQPLPGAAGPPRPAERAREHRAHPRGARQGPRRRRGRPRCADRRERRGRVLAPVKLPVAPNRELGQHFLVDDNILGVIGRLAELDAGRRRARGRAGPRRSHRIPRRAGRARARRRARPRARAASAERLRGRENVELHVRRRAPPRPRRARARPDEVRREPAVQRRDAADRREPRRPAERRSLDGHGPARGRRPPVRAAAARRRTARSRCSCSSQPSAPASIPSPGRSSGRRRTSTPRSSRSAGSRCPRTSRTIKQRRRGGVRAPAQDAAELGRARRPRAARAGGRGAGRDRPRPRRPGRSARAARVRRAHAPRCDEVARRPGEDQPGAGRRPGPARREARGRDRAPAGRPRRPDLARGRARPSTIDGFPEDTLVRDALLALAEAAAVEPSWSVRIEKRIPVAAGLGGGSSDAAAALRLANETLPSPLACRTSARACRRTGRRRPVLPDRRHAARHR